MPDNVLRVVLHSGNGRWYRFERDGDRLDAMPTSGWSVLTSGVNKIHVYRVTDERGAFQSMVASAEHPATLSVYVADSASGNLTLKEGLQVTAFSTDHIEFTLAGDYSGDGSKIGRVEFSDGTVGAITASFSSALLYQQRGEGAAALRSGTWKILAATVANLSDKRIRFESSDPSVCRIERGEMASSYMKLASSQEQADQYCVLIGAGVGSCTINCYSEADGTLAPAVVQIEVQTHPDDPPAPLAPSALAAEVQGILNNVRATVACSPYRYFSGTQNSGYQIDVREIVLPGSADDLFQFTLSFSGTVPKWHESSGSVPVLMLFVGVADTRRLGWAPLGAEALVASLFGDGAVVAINSTGTSTEVLAATKNLSARGGDRIVFGWAFANPDVEFLRTTAQLPDGVYTALMTCGAVTHYGPNQAP